MVVLLEALLLGAVSIPWSDGSGLILSLLRHESQERGVGASALLYILSGLRLVAVCLCDL